LGRRHLTIDAFVRAIDSLMAMLDALIVTTALSSIRVDLGGSIEEIESSP
jgi:hypothetical protein